jgi:alcohol dehydrogenase (NADP+)
VVPIPFSVKAAQYQASLRCALPDVHRITDVEMEELARIDKNCRLIKGHVFLWMDGQTWEDLWDLDGTIAQ